MIELVPESINQKAPYSVIPYGVDALRFMTDNALVYEAGFTEDYTFLEENAYQFYLKEITGSSGPTDIKIMQTVAAIIEEFFSKNESVAIYICDTSDGRQAVRDRIFTRWFEQAENKEKYTLLHASGVVDGIGYYSSVLVKNDNPDLELVIEAFNLFKQMIRDKFPDVSVE